MSNQLAHALVGQYSFRTASDRLATARNMRFGGSAVTLTIVASVATLNAALGSVFKSTASEDFSLMITNAVEGQRIIPVLIASGGAVSLTISSNLGSDPTSVSDGSGAMFQITKVGAGFYAAQFSLGTAT